MGKPGIAEGAAKPVTLHIVAHEARKKDHFSLQYIEWPSGVLGGVALQ